MTGHNPVDSLGAAQAKTGRVADALDRGRGYSATLGSIEDKTMSQHPANKGVNYHYEGVSGYGDNENIVGQGTGNGGESVPQGTY